MTALTAEITHEYISLFPHEAVKEIELMLPEVAGKLIEVLPAQAIGKLCAHTSVANSLVWLSHLPPEKAVAVLNILATDISALLIRRLSKEQKAQVLQQLPEDKKVALLQSLDYSGNTIGAITDPVVLSVPDDMSIQHVLDFIRDAQSYEHQFVYVVNRNQVLLGVLSLREFIVAKPLQTAKSLMKKPRLVLSAKNTRKALKEAIYASTDEEIPVVDSEQRLLGVLRKSTLARLEATDDNVTERDSDSMIVSFAELFWQITSMFLPTSNKKDSD